MANDSQKPPEEPTRKLGESSRVHLVGMTWPDGMHVTYELKPGQALANLTPEEPSELELSIRRRIEERERERNRQS